MPADPSGVISPRERRNRVGNSKTGNTTTSSVIGRSTTSSDNGGGGGKITAGVRCTIAEATEIRGNVHFGDGTIIHPTALIHCVQEDAKITFGKDCIIEERVQIIYQGLGEMRIGDRNLFEVGCRIDCDSIGSHNTFECKSRVMENVTIQDFTTIGAGCIAQSPPDWIYSDEQQQKDTNKTSTYAFPSRTVIYGDSSTARIWSGNGVRQADALYAKHQEHLRRSMPKEFKLKMIK